MKIDPSKDTLISIREACKALPRRPSPSTVWRWTRKGANGVRLEAVCIGSEWFTTREAFREFVEAQTSAVLRESADSEADLDQKLVQQGLLG